MPELISPEYLSQITNLHTANSGWGTTGSYWLKKVTNLISTHGIDSVLDYGCGKGRLPQDIAWATKPMVEVCGYDPAVPEYAKRPDKKYDLVTCTDVLEHIEPAHLNAVLADIHLHCYELSFFVVSCRPAKAILPDGRNAHLIIETPQWWENELFKFFEDVDSYYDSSRCEFVSLRRPRDLEV